MYDAPRGIGPVAPRGRIVDYIVNHICEPSIPVGSHIAARALCNVGLNTAYGIDDARRIRSGSSLEIVQSTRFDPTAAGIQDGHLVSSTTMLAEVSSTSFRRAMERGKFGRRADPIRKGRRSRRRDVGKFRSACGGAQIKKPSGGGGSHMIYLLNYSFA
jgi:hypothetical protein